MEPQIGSGAVPAGCGGDDSLDVLNDVPAEQPDTESDENDENADRPGPPYTGLGIYDPHAEALTW